jgi:hypothetical protein
MKGKIMSFIELSDNQSRVQTDIKQTFEAYSKAAVVAKSFLGGMHWKTVNKNEYLIRVTNRTGGNKSLGPRSAETERIYSDFIEGKKKSSGRLLAVESSMSEMSRMAVAIGINRVPNVVAGILRQIDRSGLLGKSLQVIGTNSMYGYESAAGVMFDVGLLATTDVDFMRDASSKLKLTVSDKDFDLSGALSLLKKADPSFEPLYKDGFRAVNKKGFFVDLVRAPPSPPWKTGIPDRISAEDLVPSCIDSLRWLISSPKFKSIVIAQDGTVAPIVSPDPRAFALHKIWLSEQDDREPEKRNRDKKQALAVADLVKEKLTYLKFGDDVEKIFPSGMRSVLTIGNR